MAVFGARPGHANLAVVVGLRAGPWPKKKTRRVNRRMLFQSLKSPGKKAIPVVIESL